MNDIITDNLTEFIATVKKQMESNDPIVNRYADKFYLSLQKTPDIVKKRLSFHIMHEIWRCMVYPLLKEAEADGYKLSLDWKGPWNIPRNTPDYVQEELEVATGEGSEFGIFYKGGQIELNEIVLRLNRLSALEDAVYKLQMNDTHLEFISRVQDVGMHHDWNEFMDTLEMVEKQLR